jgi:hypothetical protein
LRQFFDGIAARMGEVVAAHAVIVKSYCVIARTRIGARKSTVADLRTDRLAHG